MNNKNSITLKDGVRDHITSELKDVIKNQGENVDLDEAGNITVEVLSKDTNLHFEIESLEYDFENFVREVIFDFVIKITVHEVLFDRIAKGLPLGRADIMNKLN
jgi:hypothetical protein